jgi:hypothetical protein
MKRARSEKGVREKGVRNLFSGKRFLTPFSRTPFSEALALSGVVSVGAEVGVSRGLPQEPQ